jgi:hypothetical protein
LKGKIFYLKAEVTKKKIASQLKEGVNFLKNLGEDAKDCIKLNSMIDSLVSKQEFIHLSSVNELYELKNALVDAMKKGKDPKKISSILDDCTKKIRGLK